MSDLFKENADTVKAKQSQSVLVKVEKILT